VWSGTIVRIGRSGSTCAKGPTRRQSQRHYLSRSVLAHGSRQVAAWLIFDVSQNMKKLSVAEVQESMGDTFVWKRDRHWKGVGPAEMTIELVELEDARIGNILVRFSTLAVLHPFEPPSRAIMGRLFTLLQAHGFSAQVEDVRQDLLAAAQGLITTGGERFVGVSYKELSSMGLLQVKFTYEPER
jgi:hypothetical protein